MQSLRSPATGRVSLSARRNAAQRVVRVRAENVRLRELLPATDILA
jgi:hypothetical protein